MTVHEPDPKDRLILALDVATADEANRLVDELDGLVSFYKVGYQLFLATGMQFVRDLVSGGKRVFLDLKMDDVEETITQGVREIAKNDVDFLTIHGNGATARAAIEGRGDNDRPKILSVTLLSSLDEQDLIDLGILGKKGKFKSLDQYVLWRAQQAVDANVDGLIASGDTVAATRKRVGDGPILVTPGVRPKGIPTDDHKRHLTPMEAIASGADYLVVGRPIRNADDRCEMARSIIGEIEKGLDSRT